MIRLNIYSDSKEYPAEISFSVQDNDIEICVFSDKKDVQFDFTIEQEEWETFKNFIEKQFKAKVKSQTGN